VTDKDIKSLITKEVQEKIDSLIKKYPNPKSAVMPILYIIQDLSGKLADAEVSYVASVIGIPAIKVKELVSFYTMYHNKKLGKYNIQLCKTISCHLNGAKDVLESIENELGISKGQTTEDDLFSLELVECLGSCGTAPVCQINDHYFENLTKESILQIIKDIKTEKPDLKLSKITDDFNGDFKKYKKSDNI